MKVNAYSVEEAIEIAKNELDIGEGNYDVNVISPPEKKWIGLVKKAGLYEIILKEKTKPTPIDKPNAYVEIKDGQIHVLNPLDNEAFPRLTVKNENITLFVNEMEVTSQCALKESDVIRVVFHNTEPIARVLLSINDDKMEASLSITRKNGRTFFLKDMAKTSRGEIEVGYTEILPREITLEECLELLENGNIKKEFIDYNSIDELLFEGSSSTKIVARGVPLVESVEADIEYSPALNENEQKSIIEPIVNIGEVLARKKSNATEGTEGITVTGETLKPKKVRDIVLQTGEGAKFSEDGKSVISTIKGRPHLKKGIITVIPILTINGDLSPDMGNIKFEGDVVVKGNVLDGSSIIAMGKVDISGSAYKSDIMANQSVNIQGKAIGCKIQAGEDKSKLYLSSSYFEEINTHLVNMFNELKNDQSNQVQEKVNIIHKFKELIDSRIKDIETLTTIMGKNDHDKVSSFLKELKNGLLQTMLLKEEGFKILLNFYNEMVDYLQQLSYLTDETVEINISYVQSSELNSCGNINITGKGSYQSNLVAQNQIIYSSTMGVVRGGTLIAGSKIAAGIVGTPGEIYTELRVLKENGVITGSYYSGTVVFINNVKQNILTK